MHPPRYPWQQQDNGGKNKAEWRVMWGKVREEEKVECDKSFDIEDILTKHKSIEEECSKE